MTVKRISWNDFNSIMNYRKRHILSRIVCNFFLERKDKGSYVEYSVVSKIKLPIFIIMYPIMCIFDFLYCLWDGGLRTITFRYNREILRYKDFGFESSDGTSSGNTNRYSICKFIWENR